MLATDYKHVTEEVPPREGCELRISKTEKSFGVPYWTHPNRPTFWMFARAEDRDKSQKAYMRQVQAHNYNSNAQTIQKYRVQETIHPAPVYNKGNMNSIVDHYLKSNPDKISKLLEKTANDFISEPKIVEQFNTVKKEILNITSNNEIQTRCLENILGELQQIHTLLAGQNELLERLVNNNSLKTEISKKRKAPSNVTPKNRATVKKKKTGSTIIIPDSQPCQAEQEIIDNELFELSEFSE